MGHIVKTRKSTRCRCSPQNLSCGIPLYGADFCGGLVSGLTYGVLMHTVSFSFWYPMLMSLTVFAGSMEFVAANLLLGAFTPVKVFLLTLMINARHLFYGVSMLDRYKNTGWKKPYLIFGLCDESFSINCSAEIPPEVDRGWFMFFVTLLNHFYWVFGATLGGVFGTFLTFNTERLDFVMTAMFVVIFLDQWRKEKNHTSAVLGVASSALCLILFGAENFIVPSMAVILLLLTAMRYDNDADRTNRHRSGDCPRHDAHTVFAVFAVPRRQTHAEIFAIPRQSSACRGIRAVGGLLFEKCRYSFGQSRHSGTVGDCSGYRTAFCGKSKCSFPLPAVRLCICCLCSLCFERNKKRPCAVN